MTSYMKPRSQLSKRNCSVSKEWERNLNRSEVVGAKLQQTATTLWHATDELPSGEFQVVVSRSELFHTSLAAWALFVRIRENLISYVPLLVQIWFNAINHNTRGNYFLARRQHQNHSKSGFNLEKELFWLWFWEDQREVASVS